MENFTTFYANKKNFLIRLAVLFMLASAIARIVWSFSAESPSVMVVFVRILLPVAANLIFALVLLLRAGEQLYVTRVPVALFAICFIDRVLSLGIPVAMNTICIILCIFSAVLYNLTYRGYFKQKIWVLLVYLLPIAIFFMDKTFRRSFFHYPNIPLIIADLGVVFAIAFTILASKPLTAPLSKDHLRVGDRLEGRQVYTADPMARIQGYIMPYRVGASNQINDKVEISNMERYIHRKRKEGFKHFGITHVIIASYVRAISELPGVNRFFSGQKIFNRFDIVVSMIVKKEFELNKPDTLVKIHLCPSDTAEDVYNKYNDELQKAQNSDDTGFDNLVGLLNLIPGLLLKFVVWCLTVLDYFGFLPKAIEAFSPFHASMFITSMGSLGIPPIVHHLYNFGNCPVFCAFGAKRSEKSLDSDGNVITKKYLDYTWNTDERIVDGFYYAAMLKKMRNLMAHPDQLDLPPEKVIPDID